MRGGRSDGDGLAAIAVQPIRHRRCRTRRYGGCGLSLTLTVRMNPWRACFTPGSRSAVNGGGPSQVGPWTTVGVVEESFHARSPLLVDRRPWAGTASEPWPRRGRRGKPTRLETAEPRICSWTPKDLRSASRPAFPQRQASCPWWHSSPQSFVEGPWQSPAGRHVVRRVCTAVVVLSERHRFWWRRVRESSVPLRGPA